MEGKTAFREHFFQAVGTRSKIIEMLQPVSLDTAIADGRAKDERQIDEVMQACRKQDTLGERIRPYTNDTTGLEEILELHDCMLDNRPYKAEYQCHRDHDGKADRYDKRRTFKNSEPVRNFRIVEAVMKGCRYTGDEDCPEHTHIEGLDVGNHGQPRSCTSSLTVVHAESAAVQGKEP